MKSYTNLEQSKKLANILSLESADMYYYTVNGHSEWYETPNILESIDDLDMDGNSIPCWSLAALLEIIPGCELSRSVDNNTKWEASAWKDPDLELLMRVDGFSNPIDACYDMIIKLNELNLI